MRFHLPFTRRHGDDENDHENANIWIRNPKWIDMKTERYENITIWKRIRVTRASDSVNAIIYGFSSTL